jgi:hypothetical protein
MGISKLFFGLNSIISSTSIDNMESHSKSKSFIKPNDHINKQIKDFQKQILKDNRKNIEKKTESIHPTMGKVVKTVNNIGDTIDNAKDSFDNGIMRILFSSKVKDVQIGDHLFVQRIGYTHHGIYIGNKKVIHYLQDGVKKDSLETFADGTKIQKKI